MNTRKWNLGCLWAGVLILVLSNGWAQSTFDHFSTGFELDGAHANVTCDRCHAGGRFEGTVSTCVGCHSHFGAVRASSMPPNHVTNSGVCVDCHTTSAWSPVAFMDHVAVTGSCVSCHNGIAAQGKHPGHIVSSNQCDDCHSSLAWIPAVFDHNNVTGNCFSCHNGVDATGKHPTHIASSQQCEDCHSTIAWIPARFDHANVMGNCMSCHNGVDATGKNAGHFVTQQECDTCHTTNTWIPHIYMHVGLPYEPLDHRGNLACTECHQSNTEAVIWPAAAYQPDCAGCHANDFRSGPHKKHENPDVSYTVSELRDCTGACHVYTDSTMTTIKDNRPGPEHRISSGEF